MNPQQFLDWAFYGIVGGSAVYAVGLLQSLKNSIDQLNESVAKLIEKTVWHERELDRLDMRLTKLEEK